MGKKVHEEENASIMKSDSLNAKARTLTLEIDQPNTKAGGDPSGRDNESDTATLAPNLYVDSPRVMRFDTNISKEEIRRRKMIGSATVLGLFLSVAACVLLMNYLREHESFNALPPTQQRFMSATTTAGARSNLEQYTAAARQTGSAGDLEMAKYIRSKAIEFGISEDSIKYDDFEILTNEPDTMRIDFISSTTNESIKSFDFVDDFIKSGKKSVRIQSPPYHLYSRNGSLTAPIVYAHYGATSDYLALKAAGVDVTGKIVLLRMGGDITLPAKIIIAGKYGAVAVLTYSDPADQGSGQGKSFPDGPWRSNDSVAFGSVYMGNGDPSTPDGFSASSVERISVDEVYSEDNTYNILPPVPSMPISADVAHAILSQLTESTDSPKAQNVFGSAWTGGGLSDSYKVGPSVNLVKFQCFNKFSIKKVTNVLITISGQRFPDRYILVGAQRDSYNVGAVAPGSGNSVFIEILRGIGSLLTSGWVPYRTIILSSFDGEEFGSVGTSEWIDRHQAHLGSRGVVFIKILDSVRGNGVLKCEAAASVRRSIFKMANSIVHPEADVKVVNSDISYSRSIKTDTYVPTNTSLYKEDLADSGDSVYSFWLKETRKATPSATVPYVALPGTRSRISPFLARLGIPTLELHFDGDYNGVEGTTGDTVDWMKKFGDPKFTYHRAAAQLYGSIMLHFSDSIFLQYDFIETARELRRGKAYLLEIIQEANLTLPMPVDRLETSIKIFEQAAIDVEREIQELSDEMVNVVSGELVVDLKRVREINTRMLMTERAFLLPSGVTHMPWLKHAVYGISEWDDYRVRFFPGVAHEIRNENMINLKRELIRLCQTIEQAADTLSTNLL